MEGNTLSPFISCITTQFTLFPLTSILPLFNNQYYFSRTDQFYSVLTFSFILLLLLNFIFFPLWKNSMDCFVWSLCHVLYYLREREYLYLFSIFLMWKLHYSPLSDSLVTPFYVCPPFLLSITSILMTNFIF